MGKDVKFSRDMPFPESFSEAMIARARKAADGDADAQLAMAEMYRRGDGVAVNVVESLTWYERAFKSGAPEAAYRLGRIHARGLVVDKDVPKAILWHQRAATAGHVQAMIALGNIMARGVGIKKDLSTAAKWYGKAAKLHDAGAQFVYGLMLRDGRGISRDRIAAYIWIYRAIEKKMPDENQKIALDTREALLKRMSPEERIRAKALAAAYEVDTDRGIGNEQTDDTDKPKDRDTPRVESAA